MLEDDFTLDPESVPAAERATLLDLDGVLPLLASPDTHERLSIDARSRSLSCKDHAYPLVDGLPLLYPSRVQSYLAAGRVQVPAAAANDPLLQYLHINALKQQQDNTNSPHTDVVYLQHVYRARTLLRDARGTVLDVGCDSPQISRAMFPNTVDYVGLDVMYADKAEFRLIGLAEFLPVADGSVDNVALLTSLDHVLDYHRAIDEAWRVLKPGGVLFLATLVWTHDAELFHDSVHFHHFRWHEIDGALERFQIEEMRRYSWKGNAHRKAVYLTAKRR